MPPVYGFYWWRVITVIWGEVETLLKTVPCTENNMVGVSEVVTLLIGLYEV